VPSPREVHRNATRVMSLAMVAIGIAMIVSTIVHGGGGLAIGLLLGTLFVLAGAGRLYVGRRGG
jgi:hypothetical protein